MINENEYLIFVVEEKCNSKCNICCVGGAEGPLIDLSAISIPTFKKFLEVIPQGKYTGVKFSGGEVTLNPQLAEYASHARDKGFKNIMIQTNARALADLRKAKELKAAGINQFFVSFHAADNDLSDKITGRAGAHAQTLKGLENLRQLDMTVITNTVMNAMNYMVLPDIARVLVPFGNITEMQFWGYSPMSLKAFELVLPYGVAAPYLNEAIKYLISHDKEICIKYFPVCLLEDPYKKYHNNDQPIVLGIKDNYIDRSRACNFQNYPCCEGTDCKGLPEVYINSLSPDGWMPLMTNI